MKPLVDTGRISSSGRVLLPEAMLKDLALEKDGEVVFIQEREGILVRPLRKNARARLYAAIAKAEKARQEFGLSQKDRAKSLMKVRRERRR
jgi:antitoxin component of MazEF toxin-antitoxin module